MSVISRTLQTPRLFTHFLDTVGGGQTVVFIHGNDSSSEFFEPLMLSLSGDSRVRLVAPDLRGFGRSEDKPIDATRGVRDFSDDLHSLLTTLEGVSDKVVLCGWSVGGAVVMQYAVDHPERVAGLVLEAPMSPYGLAEPETPSVRLASLTLLALGEVLPIPLSCSSYARETAVIAAIFHRARS